MKNKHTYTHTPRRFAMKSQADYITMLVKSTSTILKTRKPPLLDSGQWPSCMSMTSVVVVVFVHCIMCSLYTVYSFVITAGGDYFVYIPL